jgi:AraC-like DNA-binding protein
VKPRYIRSLFESDGTTLSAFIRTRRLHLAHHMLGDPRLLHRKVAEMALDCGFSDLSTFNRTFRREFGMTPTEVRAGAMKAGNL